MDLGNHYAVRVMMEIGIDISHQYAKSIDSIESNQIAVAITLYAEEVCPLFFGNVHRTHWPFLDPLKTLGDVKQILESFRQVRDGILQQIETTNWSQYIA